VNEAQFRDVILRCVLEFNFPTDTGKLFAKLRSNPDVISFINTSIDEFQNTNNNLLLVNIARTYIQNNKIFHPNFLYKIHSEIQELETPLLCLNLHSNFSPLTKLVLEKNYSIYILSDFPSTVKQMTYYSGILKGDIKTFPRDSNSLLTAKNLLSSSKIISATIDFGVVMPGIFNYLSDSMLRLAYSIKPNTFFGALNTDDHGNIEYSTYRVNFSLPIEETKQEILKFIQKVRVQHNHKWKKFDYDEQNKMIQEFLS
jgi:hypothetical protein